MSSAPEALLFYQLSRMGSLTYELNVIYFLPLAGLGFGIAGLKVLEGTLVLDQILQALEVVGQVLIQDCLTGIALAGLFP